MTYSGWYAIKPNQILRFTLTWSGSMCQFSMYESDRTVQLFIKIIIGYLKPYSYVQIVHIR